MGFPRHLTGVPATFLGLEVHGQNNPWPRDLDHHARCKLNLVWNLPPILFLPKAAFTPSLQGPWNHGAAGIEHCAPIVRYRRHHGPRPVTPAVPYLDALLKQFKLFYVSHVTRSTPSPTPSGAAGPNPLATPKQTVCPHSSMTG